MENILLTVKNKIEVPKELDIFSYRLNYSNGNSSGNKYWNFEWMDKERNKIMTIRADEVGNILLVQDK